MRESGLRVADPFDLPDWIGSGECTWTTSESVGDARVDGVLVGTEKLELSVLAADVAYPIAAVDEQLRHDVHQAWVHGEVLLLSQGERFILAVPGTSLDVDTLYEVVRRFARAVGARPACFTVALQL
ncbi:hypothetical protein BH20ACT6_BH20ACT6_09950 [soil metagenome]